MGWGEARWYYLRDFFVDSGPTLLHVNCNLKNQFHHVKTMFGIEETV